LPDAHLALQLSFAPLARADDVFETDGLARELLAHGPTEKALLVVHTDFGHIPRVIADRHVFPHIGGQRGIDIVAGAKFG
jgi:hypothetical protein